MRNAILPFCSRHGERKGVRADHWDLAAKGRNGRRGIGEAESDEALTGQIAGVETQRRRIIGVVNGEPGDAEAVRRRNELGEAFLDRRVGEAMPRIGAEGNRGELSNDRLCLAVDLPALHMAAIILQPVEAMAGETRELRVDDAVGKELHILLARAGALERLHHQLSGLLRGKDNIGHRL